MKLSLCTEKKQIGVIVCTGLDGRSGIYPQHRFVTGENELGDGRVPMPECIAPGRGFV
jgi:hypothetical protein